MNCKKNTFGGNSTCKKKYDLYVVLGDLLNINSIANTKNKIGIQKTKIPFMLWLKIIIHEIKAYYRNIFRKTKIVDTYTVIDGEYTPLHKRN